MCFLTFFWTILRTIYRLTWKQTVLTFRFSSLQSFTESAHEENQEWFTGIQFCYRRVCVILIDSFWLLPQGFIIYINTFAVNLKVLTQAVSCCLSFLKYSSLHLQLWTQIDKNSINVNQHGRIMCHIHLSLFLCFKLTVKVLLSPSFP